MASTDFDSCFWSDPLIESASKDGKLLHCYLWTNARKNVICIYTITVKTICNETGLTPAEFEKALAEISPSVKYDHQHNVVAVFAHFKRQFMKTSHVHPNFIIAAQKAIYALPTGHPFITEWLSRPEYSILGIAPSRACQAPTHPLEGPTPEKVKPLISFDSSLSTPGPTQGVPTPSGLGQGLGPGLGKGEEGGAGGETEPPPEPSPRQIVAREKAETAWRDVEHALKKHAFDGLPLVLPDNRIVRDVVKNFENGLQGMFQLLEYEPQALEKRFIERYMRRELMEFQKRAGPKKGIRGDAEKSRGSDAEA